MANLILYYKPTCPFCRKVLDFMDQNGIANSAGNYRITLKNREENPAVREELIKIGGKPQVPCLVIDGRAMYESEDIIRWIKANWRKS